MSLFEADAQASTALGSGHERQPFWAAGYVQAYIDWTILQDITFHQATSAHMHALLTFDHPQIQECLAKAPMSLSNWIKALFKQQHISIKDLLLTTLSKIHLSCDIWTFTNEMSLLGRVAHFINKDSKLQSVLLGLPQLQGLHTAENITTALAEVIKKYQFDYKLSCLITNNAYNNNNLYNYLSQSLSVPKKEQL